MRGPIKQQHLHGSVGGIMRLMVMMKMHASAFRGHWRWTLMKGLQVCFAGGWCGCEVCVGG